jgi:hypothetical protein
MTDAPLNDVAQRLPFLRSRFKPTVPDWRSGTGTRQCRAIQRLNLGLGSAITIPRRRVPNDPGRVAVAVAQVGDEVDEHQRGQRF